VAANEEDKKFIYTNEEDLESQLASHISYVLSDAIPWRYNTDNKLEDMMHMPIDLLITKKLSPAPNLANLAATLFSKA